MSFFQNLLARGRGDAGVVRPRIASMFEAPQVSEAAPVEESSKVETSSRPREDAFVRPAARSIEAPVEIQTRADVRPAAVEVQSIAALPKEKTVSASPLEKSVLSSPREQALPGLESKSLLSRGPLPELPAAAKVAESPVLREIRETHEMHETVREQRTVVDRTFLERVAQAGRQSPPARATAEAAMSAEPEIHVSIGRIEVRAVNEATSARKTQQPGSPVMGLDEYLRHKSKGAAQ